MAFNVNGQIISEDDIYEEFESIKDHYTRIGEVVCCDRDEEFMTYAKDNVLNRALLEQESVARHGDLSEKDVDTKFEQLQSEHGGELEFYEETGLDRDEEPKIRKQIKSGLVVDRVLGDLLGDLPSPSEDDLQGYYDKNVAQYMSPERVRVSQIFVEPASQEAAKEVFDTLRKVRIDLLEGKVEFEEMATKHGTNEQSEMDLGFMAQGESMPEIESITFSLQIGEVSPIIATHYGFHIFKLMDREDPAPVPMDQIEGLEDQYSAELRESTINTLIDELKEKGSIEEIEVDDEA